VRTRPAAPGVTPPETTLTRATSAAENSAPTSEKRPRPTAASLCRSQSEYTRPSPVEKACEGNAKARGVYPSQRRYVVVARSRQLKDQPTNATSTQAAIATRGK